MATYNFHVKEPAKGEKMAHSIHPNTKIGSVALTVANLARSLDYYQHAIGLKLQQREGETAVLGTSQRALLFLTEKPDSRQVKRTTGLYHFALLVPSRRELARVLQNLHSTQTLVGGFADHAVSEAIYLSDPDGHGIEIYRDRPRGEWEYPGGQLKMTVDPFDMAGVLAALEGTERTWTGLPSQTVMGHIHLHVANIAAAEQFYADVLGFDLMVRYGTSASFLAAGGYHHHLGVNTWAGAGAPPPPPDALSLQWYEICLPDAAALTAVAGRMKQANIPFAEENGRLQTQDPSGNNIILTT